VRFTRRTVACAVTFATVASLTTGASTRPAFSTAEPIAPSIANAKRATRSEVLLLHQVLDEHVTHHPATLTIGCKRVAQHLYHCSFSGEASSDLYVYVLSGKSKVQFSKTTARANLFDLSCNTWSWSDVSYDLC
jgi:hypothetical protein